MRKQKTSRNYINTELTESVNMSTPSPDHGMVYNGLDMYWNPEMADKNNKENINHNKNILIDLV